VRDIEAAMKHWVEVCGVGPWFYTDKLAVTEFSYRGARHQISFLPEMTRSVDALLRELTILDKAKAFAGDGS